MGFHHDLIVAARRRHVELEEIPGGDFAPAIGSRHQHAAAGQHQDHRHFGRGIGMTETADDGAAIADRDMGDMTEGGAQDRIGGGGAVMKLELAMARHRTDRDLAIGGGDVPEARNVLDVD